MTSLAIEPRLWTWRRWCVLIALTFCIQLGFISLLGDKSPVRARPASPAPKISLALNSSREMIALADPTLFALPHQVGFSGPAWMLNPPPPSRSFEWTEEPRWLPLPIDQLGTSPPETTQPQLPTTFVAFEPEPMPSETVFPTAFRQKSAFRLAAGLEQRHLKTTFKLPSWPNSDFLTNTIVKLFINGEGLPVSVPVLLSSSGLKAADDYALAQSGIARFEPIINEGPSRSANPLANSTWGTIIFEWHTLPILATNATPPNR